MTPQAPSRLRTPRSTQRGQALTEFLVVALALLPLFLLIPLIAKYQDIAHATEMASRYAAFDAAAHIPGSASAKPETQLADEVRKRFFGATSAAVKTGDVAGDFKADQNLFWRGPSNAALIGNIDSQVAVSYGAAPSPVYAGGFQGAADGAPFLLKAELGLRARGIFQANVSVRIGDVPSGLKLYQPFDTLHLTMTRSTGLVVDPWNAESADAVANHIDGKFLLFPTAALRAVSPVVDGLVAIVDLPGPHKGPSLGRLTFWDDVVPKDRLTAR